jgi:cysteine-S-conjugate beta-lyase
MSQFDVAVDRRGSGSYKWDGNLRLFGRADLLPFWVADMDFATPAPILRALEQRMRHPVLGYEERQPEYAETVIDWLARRHDWTVPAEWLKFCPPSSIVAMYGLISTLTERGDGIIVPTPTYGPLIDLVRKNHRRLVRNPLLETGERFELDIDGLADLIDDRTKMILLCSPHNPTGRVFTEAELGEVARLAAENDLIVVSDEVHADLCRPGQRHRPFGSFGYRRSATVISPNKSFNTAGLPQASLIIPDAAMRDALQRFLNVTQLNHDSTFGGVAMQSAYRECEDWLDEVVRYIDANHRRVLEFVTAGIPGLRVWPAEATYLAWLDYRQLGMDEAEVQRRLVYTGGVGLYSGSLFGDEGTGFLRMNVACPRPTLDQGLAGLQKALGN